MGGVWRGNIKRHIKKLGESVSEEVVDFINGAVDFTIYDELVEVATKAIIDNFPKYLEYLISFVRLPWTRSKQS